MDDNLPLNGMDAGGNSSFSDGCDDPYTDSPSSTPPLPSFQEIDFQNRHIALKDFGRGLQAASQALFPNEEKSRYSRVSVLMLSWEDEDPNLPVSIEIFRLRNVFREVYGFDVEEWAIPDQDSHFEVNSKITNFVRPAKDDKEHLKIVYYAGHGRLTSNRTLAWTSWRNKDKKAPPNLNWSGIQALLEQAQSDVLILLDCCASGIVNTGEGNGVTELISACSYNSKANGVGLYSFTNELVIELKQLSQRPSFSVGELYSNIYRRVQTRMPEDGRERHPPPIHLTLTQEYLFLRSIQLSVRHRYGEDAELTTDSTDQFNLSEDGNAQLARGSNVSCPDRMGSSSTTKSNEQLPVAGLLADINKVPRLAFAIRLKDTFRISELSEDLFKDWLRIVPALAEEVKVEAGFDSFSSLLVLSMPISMSIYLPQDPAVICLGPITSRNLIWRPYKPIGDLQNGFRPERKRVSFLRNDRSPVSRSLGMARQSLGSNKPESLAATPVFASFTSLMESSATAASRISNTRYNARPLQSVAVQSSSLSAQQSTLLKVIMQLEYYFSIDSLCKDIITRKQMDSQGFVFLSFVAGFKPVEALTSSFEILRYACHESKVIEIIQGEDGIDRIRRREGWRDWVLDMKDRDYNAKNGGPEQYLRPLIIYPPRHMSNPLESEITFKDREIEKLRLVINHNKTSHSVTVIQWQNDSVSKYSSLIFYRKFLARVLSFREFSEPGETHPEMEGLYTFWSYFLVTNFNLTMYNEFRRYAMEDAERKYMIGFKCLASYYDEVLRRQIIIHDTFARHYIELVMYEKTHTGSQEDRPALAKLREALCIVDLHTTNRKKIDTLIDLELRDSEWSGE